MVAKYRVGQTVFAVERGYPVKVLDIIQGCIYTVYYVREIYDPHELFFVDEVDLSLRTERMHDDRYDEEYW